MSESQKRLQNLIQARAQHQHSLHELIQRTENRVDRLGNTLEAFDNQLHVLEKNEYAIALRAFFKKKMEAGDSDQI